jgi:uncharacterized protein YdcH (DUF465 family)
MLKRVNHQFAKLSHEHDTLYKYEYNLSTNINKTDDMEKKSLKKSTRRNIHEQIKTGRVLIKYLATLKPSKVTKSIVSGL